MGRHVRAHGRVTSYVKHRDEGIRCQGLDVLVNSLLNDVGRMCINCVYRRYGDYDDEDDMN